MGRLFSPFLYTIEDFLEQPLIMQACIGWGWLSVVIMVLSFAEGVIAAQGG